MKREPLASFLITHLSFRNEAKQSKKIPQENWATNLLTDRNSSCRIQAVHRDKANRYKPAEVVKLVDTQRSGRCAREGVGVRVPPSA